MISRMSQRRAPISIVGFLALLTSIVAVGCGSSGSSTGSSNAADTSTVSGRFAGTTAHPVKPVPPLALKNSLGQLVNITDYRGKAVLVTFIYDHCPDICPIIVGNLHTAQNELGSEADKVQIIAVSVDPKGDTPRTVKAFLKDHQMTGRMQYLIGSRPQLEQVWHNWNIVSKSDPSRKIPDAVEHSALIYGISASGKVTTLYPANFKPAQIVHDVPMLAAS
jgi:protein SCO1/2